MIISYLVAAVGNIHSQVRLFERQRKLVAFRKKHPRATLEDVIATTSYTRSDFRIELARGSLLKA
jgi:hypothetical protein